MASLKKSFLLVPLLIVGFSFFWISSARAQLATLSTQCPTSNPAGTLVCDGKRFVSGQCRTEAEVTGMINVCTTSGRNEVFNCSTGACVCPSNSPRDCRGGGMAKCLTTAERDAIDAAGAARCTLINRTYNNCAAAVTAPEQCGGCIAGTQDVDSGAEIQCSSIAQVNARVTMVDTDVTTLEGQVTRLLDGIYTFTGPLSIDGFAISLTGCAANQVLKWDTTRSPAAWACADDIDTDTNTTYTAAPGGGLSLTGTAFSSDLGPFIESAEITDGTIAAADLGSMNCAINQVLKRNVLNSAWVCAADIDTDTNTTYTAAAAGGLSLTNTAFSLDTTNCVGGEVWKRNAGNTAWECVPDANTGSQWTTSGSDISYSAGKVGIGTIAPMSNLHISSAADSWLALEADTNDSGEDDNAWISFSQDNGAVASVLGTVGNAGKSTNSAVNYTDTLANTTLFGTTTNYPLQLGTNSSVRVTIENGGDVGIGLTNPTQKLEVDNGNFLVQGSGSFDAANEEAILYLGDTNHYMKSVYGAGVRIGTYQAADAIAIKQTSGNVGIGTTNPESPLEISSTTDNILRLRQNEANLWNYIEFYGPVDRTWWVGQDNEGDFNIIDSAGAGAGAGLTVENGGFVGIGQRDPSAQLDVVGNIELNGDLDFIQGDTSKIHSLGSLSFDWTAAGTYDSPANHGIRSTAEDGATFTDELSINSYDNVFIRLDTNANNATSVFKIENETTGNGADLFTVASPSGNTTITGNLTVNGTGAYLPDDSIQGREIATNAVTAKQLMADSVNAAELNYYFSSNVTTDDLAPNGTGETTSYCLKGDYALSGQCWGTWADDSVIDASVPYSTGILISGQNVVPAPSSDTTKGQGWRCSGWNRLTGASETRWLHSQALCINSYYTYMLNLSDYPDIIMPSTTSVTSPQIFTNDDLINPYILNFDPNIFFDPSIFFVPPIGL